MKIVLVQPKIFHSWEALNIGYLKSYAEQFNANWQFEFYSGYFDSDREIIDGCSDADYVGFSATTPATVHARELAGKLKLEGIKAKTILGGVHASAQPNHLKNEFDYIVKGEGEMALVNILLNDPKPGIITYPYMSNLDNLPMPDRKFIKQERNIAVTEKNDNERIGAIFSSRGCPFRCRFCSSHEVWGRNARLHSAKRIFKEMTHLRDDWSIDFIKFSDDTFTLNDNRIIELCDLIKYHKFEVPWGCNIRANTPDWLLKRMKDANCREVWIGAESGSPNILKDMRKGITVQMIEHVFEETKRLGFFRRVYFLLGWPSETKEDLEMTRELARKIEADQYGFSMLCPYPNNIGFNPTLLDSMDWSIADEYGNPTSKTDTLSHQDLVNYQTEFIREFNDKMCYRQRSERQWNRA